MCVGLRGAWETERGKRSERRPHLGLRAGQTSGENRTGARMRRPVGPRRGGESATASVGGPSSEVDERASSAAFLGGVLSGDATSSASMLPSSASSKESSSEMASSSAGVEVLRRRGVCGLTVAAGDCGFFRVVEGVLLTAGVETREGRAGEERSPVPGGRPKVQARRS